MKANRAGGGSPVPGKFLGRAGLRPVGGAGKSEEKEESSKPAVSNQPMSIQERIKLLNKKPGPTAEETEVRKPPPKPADGVSPCTGRKMTRDNSVSDLIKSYHSGGGSTGGTSSSEGERSRPMSPEAKPSIPAKPSALSPKHSNTSDRSPHIKRKPLGQQLGPAPSLPERRAAAALPWKKGVEEEAEPVKRPPWQTEERERLKHWKKEVEPEERSWRRERERDSQATVWKKPAADPPQPSPEPSTRTTSFIYK